MTTEDLCKDFARAVKTLFPDIRDWTGPVQDFICSTERARSGEDDLVLVFATGREARLLAQYLRACACMAYTEKPTPDGISGPVTLNRSPKLEAPSRLLLPAPGTNRAKQRADRRITGGPK